MKSHRIVVRHAGKKQPVVWVIDNEQWPRACLRAELIERGCDTYGFIRIDDALDALSEGTSPKPMVVILELRGQNTSDEAIQAICDVGVPVILLGGNTELSDALVQRRQWDVVLKRPFSLGKIAEVTQQIISKHRMTA